MGDFVALFIKVRSACSCSNSKFVQFSGYAKYVIISSCHHCFSSLEVYASWFNYY